MIDKFLNPSAYKILDMLLKGERSLTEISRSLNVSKPSVMKYMDQLVELGLVRSRYNITRIGREKIFQIGQCSMVLSLDPDKGIIAYANDETIDLDNPLTGQIIQKEYRDASRIYLNEIVKVLKIMFTIIIFGSIARAEATSKSDIDILFLVDGTWSKRNRNSVMEALHKGSMNANIQAKPVFLTLGKFLESKGRLENQIKNEGLILYDSLESDRLWEKMKRYWNITN